MEANLWERVLCQFVAVNPVYWVDSWCVYYWTAVGQVWPETCPVPSSIFCCCYFLCKLFCICFMVKLSLLVLNNLKSHVKYRVCNKEQVVKISFLCPSLICQLNEFSVFEIWSSHTSSLLPDAHLCPCPLSVQITLFFTFTRVS